MASKEAIELLENFRARGRYAGNIKKVDQALAKLKTEQPPASEFTKEIRASIVISDAFDQTEGKPSNPMIKPVFDLCDRLDTSEASKKAMHEALTKASQEFTSYKIKRDKQLDTSEASRKELLDNLKMIVSLLCHPGSFVSAEDIEKAKVAIAKARKEGGE